MSPSKDYYAALEATQRFHVTHGAFSGKFLTRYAPDIRSIVQQHECRTLLDYGCGKGVQWERPLPSGQMLAEYLGISEVTKYDPGYVPFSAEPVGTFDVVICTQVLCHIPTEDMGWVVDRLFSYATKAVYIGERLAPVKKGVHKHMRDKMPQNWRHDRWLAALRRPSTVAGYLRTKDSVEGGTAFERFA